MMKILSSQTTVTTVNTYIIEHDGRNLQYQEWVNEKNKVDEFTLSDTATGEDIDDEELRDKVSEFVDRYGHHAFADASRAKE